MPLTETERKVLQETHDVIITHVAKSEPVFEMVDRHERTLHGNRRWGLVANMRLVLWLLGIVSGLIITIGGGIAVKTWGQ